MFKNKEGFTLIELIIVMAIIAILVLIAAPKFMDYVEIAKLTQIKNDTKVAENIMMAKMANDELDFNTLLPTDKKEGLNKDSKDMEDTTTLIGNTYDITKLVNSKLSGIFIINEEGIVVYYDKNIDKNSNESIWIAKDSDFQFIEHENYAQDYIEGIGYGYFKYIGDEKIVEIPHKINKHKVTSYYRMFEGTNVEKVISTNKNIINMGYMFKGSTANKIDISELTTTNNTKFANNMFHQSNAENIIFPTTFKTSHYEEMFRYAKKLKTLDISSFDMSDVSDTENMFLGVPLEKLYVSSSNYEIFKIIYKNDNEKDYPEYINKIEFIKKE